MLRGLAATALQHTVPSPTLVEALRQIEHVDATRARKVLAFYQDLDIALKEIVRVSRPGSYQCWVVGRRTVKKSAPENHGIIALSQRHSLIPVTHFARVIPHKRMSKENSPTNAVGEKVTTMNGEKIFILRKRSV